MRQQNDMERKNSPQRGDDISKIKMEAMDKEYQILHMVEE